MSTKQNKLNVGLFIVGIVLFGLGLYILWHATRGTYVKTDELIQAAAIGGVGLLLWTGVLAKRFNQLVGAIVFVIVAGGIAAYVVTSMAIADTAEDETKSRFDLVRSFIPLCDGEASPEAAEYQLNGQIVPTVILWQPSNGEWMPAVNDSPDGWLPETPEQTQLVACIQSVRDVIRRCSYRTQTGGSIGVNYVQYHQDITLYEASTRTKLFETRLSGGLPPDKCARSIRDFGGSRNEVSGTSIHRSGAHDAIRPYVTGATPKKRKKKRRKTPKSVEPTAPTDGWGDDVKSDPSPSPKGTNDDDSGWGW